MGRAISVAKELFSVLRMSRPWAIQSVHVQNLGKKLMAHCTVNVDQLCFAITVSRLGPTLWPG